MGSSEEPAVRALRREIARLAGGFLKLASDPLLDATPDEAASMLAQERLYRFVAEGDGFVGRALPPPYRRSTEGECYSNSASLAIEHPELTYVEGFAKVGRKPIRHAWCVDERGEVVDVTLDQPEAAVYLGVRFPHAELAERIASGDSRPLLAQRIDPET